MVEPERRCFPKQNVQYEKIIRSLSQIDPKKCVVLTYLEDHPTNDGSIRAYFTTSVQGSIKYNMHDLGDLNLSLDYLRPSD